MGKVAARAVLGLPMLSPLQTTFTICDFCLIMQRWEFFIGDTPQPEEQPAEQEGEDGAPRPRPPIAQLQAAEHFAVSGKCAGVTHVPSSQPFAGFLHCSLPVAQKHVLQLALPH